MSDLVVSDAEINQAWGNSDFGSHWNDNRRALVAQAVLKRACGYYQGHTSKSIAMELGLINDRGLTKTGKRFLWQELGSNL